MLLKAVLCPCSFIFRYSYHLIFYDRLLVEYLSRKTVLAIFLPFHFIEMAISREDVNTLVWRYLSESGFDHSAFLFKSEANIEPADSCDSQLASGALVSFLQRAILYMNLEKSVKLAKANHSNPLYSNIAAVEDRFAAPDPIPRHLQRTVGLSSSYLLKGHKREVFACQWNSDGTQLVSASADGTVILWRVHNGVAVGTKTIGSTSTPKNGIPTIDWSRDGSHIATGSFTNTVCLYTGDGALQAVFHGHSGIVFSVRFNPSGKLLASASADCNVIVWSLDTRNILTKIEHKGRVLDLDWKNDEVLATAVADGTIGIVQVDGAAQFLKGHTNFVTAVAWSPNGRWLASASEDKTVCIWKEGFNATVLQGHDACVSYVKWVPNGQGVVVSAAQNGQVIIWDAVNGLSLREYTRHANAVLSIAISPDGHFITSGGLGNSVDVTNLETGEVAVTYEECGRVYELQWDPTGRFIAVCLHNSAVAILPVHTYM